MSVAAACVSWVIDRVEGPVVVVEGATHSIDLVQELLPVVPAEGATLWLCVAASGSPPPGSALPSLVSPPVARPPAPASSALRR